MVLALKCNTGLASLYDAACTSLATSDYCSRRRPCLMATDWFGRDQVGSQLSKRLDTLRAAGASGCDDAHHPLRGNASWADKEFPLSTCRASRHGTVCAQPCEIFRFASRERAVASKRWAKHGGHFRMQRDGMNTTTGAAYRPHRALRARLSAPPLQWFRRDPADMVQLAVHMRRGDLASSRTSPTDLCFTFNRWIPDDYFSMVLTALVRELASAGLRVSVHIFREAACGGSAVQCGDAWPNSTTNEVAFDWKRILLAAGAAAVRVHAGADVVSTMWHMIEADVFIPSISGFSLIASQLSTSLVLEPGAAESSKPCVPSPPTCSALSKETARRRVLTRPFYLERGCCCFARWNESTGKCLSPLDLRNLSHDPRRKECLAAGHDLISKLPSGSPITESDTNRHNEQRGPDGRALWSDDPGVWIWCKGVASRAALRHTLLHQSMEWTRRAVVAVAELAQHKAVLLNGGVNSGWVSTWQALSHASMGARNELLPCCKHASSMRDKVSRG